MPTTTANRPSPAACRFPDCPKERWLASEPRLAKAVAEPTGTGYKTVRTPAISIAGKSGTAQVGRGQADHAWFAGYAPAEQPRIAFAVVLEHAGSGGKAAGPVARQLVEALLADGILEPARVTMRQ